MIRLPRACRGRFAVRFSANSYHMCCVEGLKGLTSAGKCLYTRVPRSLTDGCAMLMSPCKGETAVHGCHCLSDMIVRMHIRLVKLENDPIEFVQTKFIRFKVHFRAIKYWLKFCEPEHQNKLSGIAFTDQIGQDKKELWSNKLKRLLINLAGLGDIWSAKTNNSAIMSYIRQRL